MAVMIIVIHYRIEGVGHVDQSTAVLESATAYTRRHA